MRLYLVSDEQLQAITTGSAHERTRAINEVTKQQEVTIERSMQTLLSAETSKKGAA